MGRLILGILVAPVLWGMLSIPVSLLLAGFYGEAVSLPPYPISYLVISLALSFGYSTFAGWGAAWIAGIGLPEGAPRPPVGFPAGLALLVVGVLVQAGVWDTIPIWWHAVFLTMLLPMCMLGARLRG